LDSKWPQIKGTLLLRARGEGEEKKALQIAAEILQEGGRVAFPTETVYGLGASALDPDAVRGIFRAKRRPPDNPLIVHVADLEQAGELTKNIPPAAARLAEHFWPGPLTLILPKKETVPAIITAGLPSVAVRVPAHFLALKLLRTAGLPLAAPSANLSGRPSPTTAEHVLEDLAGRIEAVLDGGPCPIGVESTVVSFLFSPPALLRPGGVTLERLEEVLGAKIQDPGSGRYAMDANEAPPAPGMKYRHYAPQAPLFLVEGAGPAQSRRLLALCTSLAAQGRKIGLIVFAESQGIFQAPVCRVLSSRRDPVTAAARLYGILREMDAAGVDAIVVEGFETAGMGGAVMNRLRKAATKVIGAE
jgi:L-threonylcarbamoyladenylate synthase